MKSLKPQWKNRWHEKSLESVHQILLASRSPRRKELLRYILPNFLTDAASLDEDSFFEKQMGANRHLKYIERVERATAFLAKEKCLPFQEKDTLIIGADTTVVFANQILNKPETPMEAFETIRSLSGNTHDVVTGVSFFLTEQCFYCFSVTTKVTFRKWSPLLKEKVTNYVKKGIPMDKAGSYGIQGEGSLFVESIDGDFYNVMGLPVSAVFQELEQSGLNHDFFFGI